MSKSLGNGLSVPAVLAENSAWVVRYALGSVQYRSMLEWSDQTLAEAQSAYDRVANFIERAGAAVGEQPSHDEIAAISADALPADFVAAMNDDINVSGATAAIFTTIRSGNTLLSKLADRADSDAAKAEVREALVNVRAMLDTLGLDPLAEPWVNGGVAGGAAACGARQARFRAVGRARRSPQIQGFRPSRRDSQRTERGRHRHRRRSAGLHLVAAVIVQSSTA